MTLFMSLCLVGYRIMNTIELIKKLNTMRKNDKNWVWYDITLSVIGLNVKGFNNFLNKCLL